MVVITDNVSRTMKYVMEAYETNWMSTVGANINEIEKVAAKHQEQNMQ